MKCRALEPGPGGTGLNSIVTPGQPVSLSYIVSISDLSATYNARW